MPNDDLNAAVVAARYLASSAASIRALRADGLTTAAKKLDDELCEAYSEARSAIAHVERELQASRESSVRFGDVVAPTAHEAAVEMVFALNRERYGVEVVSRKKVESWPDVDEVLAEIEIEYAKAIARRGQEKKPHGLLPNETKIEKEEDIPAAYRDLEKPEGAPLTAKYLEENTDWSLKGPYLSKHCKQGKELTNRLRFGTSYVYVFREVAALRQKKTREDGDRES